MEKDIVIKKEELDLDYSIVKEEYTVQPAEVFEIKIKEEKDDPEEEVEGNDIPASLKDYPVSSDLPDRKQSSKAVNTSEKSVRVSKRKLSQENNSHERKLSCPPVSSNTPDNKQHNPNFRPLLRKRNKCEICGEVFRNKWTFQLHMLHHHGEKNVCPICFKTFPDNRAVKHHIHLHTAVQPYRCNQCGQIFSWKKTFTRHKENCGKEEAPVASGGASADPLTCPYCGRIYTNERMYAIHKSWHFSKSLECLYCSGKFGSRQELEGHSNSKHNGLPVDLEDAIKSGKIFNVDYRKFVKKEKL
ncbi:zinc finger protein 358-like [Lutzomyia longipalpis]|uniref:zinc finger protein 358-like n=1 Tax=Lutzomyia longipalpis TaxID=7200 RepID=UPI002483385F|nr:zinc finger protein 358-like [Lutzomyia longipalpis]